MFINSSWNTIRVFSHNGTPVTLSPVTILVYLPTTVVGKTAWSWVWRDKEFTRFLVLTFWSRSVRVANVGHMSLFGHEDFVCLDTVVVSPRISQFNASRTFFIINKYIWLLKNSVFLQKIWKKWGITQIENRLAYKSSVFVDH